MENFFWHTVQSNTTTFDYILFIFINFWGNSGNIDSVRDVILEEQRIKLTQKVETFHIFYKMVNNTNI